MIYVRRKQAIYLLPFTPTQNQNIEILLCPSIHRLKPLVCQQLRKWLSKVVDSIVYEKDLVLAVSKARVTGLILPNQSNERKTT